MAHFASAATVVVVKPNCRATFFIAADIPKLRVPGTSPAPPA
jgi:hypothetical protein